MTDKILKHNAGFRGRNGKVLRAHLSSEGGVAPTVILTSLTCIEYSTLNMIGNVTSDGGSAITQMGFIFDRFPVPNGFESIVFVIQGAGEYSRELVGLYGSEDYYVRAFATNAYGTTYSNQMSVTPPAPTIFVPDGFSPNGDGVHDKHEVVGLSYYTNHKMSIFTQEGDSVYQSTGYANNPWNGYWNNNYSSGRVPVGTYYWVLEINGTHHSSGTVGVVYSV